MTVAVDLSNYVGAIERAVNPPGVDLHPGTHPSEWRDRLADAFWAGRHKGFFAGFKENEGVITPIAENGDDMDEMWVRVIVLLAAMHVLRWKILQLPTRTSRKAGPVETTTEPWPVMLALTVPPR